MKTRMDIENLLRWAFVHELSKGGGVAGIGDMNSAWSKISGYGQLGTLIDTGRLGGGMGWIEEGEPHRDAVLIGEAVRDLAGVEIGGFADWDAFADVPHLAPHLGGIAARVEKRVAALPPHSRMALPVTLVISAAVTGRGPDWRWPDTPKARVVTRMGKPAWFAVQQVTDAFGRASTIEVDGYDPKRGRPRKGAYRRYEVAPDPFSVALSRADWQIWVTCLEMLVAQLVGCLADYEPVSAGHSLTPWVDGEAERPLRILEAV